MDEKKTSKELQDELSAYIKDVDILTKENEDLKSKNDQLIELINAMKKDHLEIYDSGSWKLTSPIRGAINLVTLGRIEGETPEYLKENNIFDALLETEKKTDDILKEYDDKYDIYTSKILKEFNPKPWDVKLLERVARLRKDIESDKKIVVHLYDKADASTFRYACYNVWQYAADSDIYRSHFFFSDECDTVSRYLDKISLLVFCRTKWRIPYASLLEDAKTMGIKVVMQIDDLVCSTDYISYLLEMNLDNKGSDFIYDSWFANVTRLEWIARKVDGFIVTNDFLGERLKEKFNKDYAVIRNSLNKEQIEVSEKLLQLPVDDKKKKFIIGYFSGSPTHKRDLGIIITDIKKLLDTYKDIEFMIVGYMDLPRALHKYVKNKRIKFRPLVNFLELQYLISQVDVNVVPLEDTLFTNCKSELKFFEASIAGTITVASPSYTYKNAISDREDGFLCAPGEWYQTIADIHDGKYNIEEILVRARKTALERYAGKTVTDEIEEAYSKFL